MTHDWPPDRFRVSFWAFCSIITVATILGLAMAYGAGIWAYVGWGVLTWPAVLLGTFPGFWLAKHMSRDHLRRVTYGLLLVIGLYAVASPWLPWGRG
jgi:uncharacterized membrane protein YfcA